METEILEIKRALILALCLQDVTLKVAEVTGASIIKDMGFDSLDMLEILMRVEDELKVQIEDDQFSANVTVNSLTLSISEAIIGVIV